MDDARDLVLEGVRLRKSFAGVEVLHGVDFQARAGEIHALVGENGAGKSTLLLILSGVHAPDGGLVRVRGEAVAFRGPAHARALGVSTVFQELSLVPTLSVAENLFLNAAPAGPLGTIDRRRMRAEARALLARVGSHADPDARVATLSRSQRQLVEIAKALRLDARALLLDEPTSSLSEAEARVLGEVLFQLRDQGLAIVIVTHRLGEVFALADRITVLRDGRLAGRFLAKETGEDEIVRHMVGRDVSAIAWSGRGEPGRPILVAEGLSAGGILRDISLELRAGEIVGVAGLEGSGRTELGLALAGALPLTQGSLRLFGEPLRLRSTADAMRRKIVYLPPDRKEEGLFLRLSVAGNVAVLVLRALARLGFVRARAVRDLAREYRDRLEVRCHSLDQPAQSLSGGNQQKTLFARVLAARPQVLVVDDPTVGVDTGAKAEIHRILLEQAREGMAIVLISSELLEILALADRVLVLRAGRLAGELRRPEITEESIMRWAAAS